MQGDEMALSRLLIILLDNAMKYSPEQTHLTLRAAKVKTHLVLEVRDEGCGISDEDKQIVNDAMAESEPAGRRLPPWYIRDLSIFPVFLSSPIPSFLSCNCFYSGRSFLRPRSVSITVRRYASSAILPFLMLR